MIDHPNTYANQKLNKAEKKLFNNKKGAIDHDLFP
jgi:hypothetical protein